MTVTERLHPTMTDVRFAVAVHILTLLSHATEPCTSAFIAGSVRSHPVVVRRVLGKLRGAGLVTGHAGPRGGFRLARDPKRIRLSDVFAAVEDHAAPASHEPNPSCPVGRQVKGIVTEIGQRAERAFVASLAQQSIADVVKDVQRRAGSTVRG